MQKTNNLNMSVMSNNGGTLNKSVNYELNNKGDQIKNKLAYEWKNIFRGLSL